MANDNLLFRKGSISGIKTAAYIPGAISITTDEPGIYIDLCEGDVGYVAGAGNANRVRVGDFIPVKSLAELNDLAANPDNVFSPRALYYSTTENMLLKYDESNKNFKWINDYSKVSNDLKILAEGAVASNTSNIATLTQNLNTEIQNRTDAVNDLQDQINSLTGGEGTNLSSLKTAIEEEKTARETADNAHNESIGELESNLSTLGAKIGDLPSGTANNTTVISYLSGLVATEQSRAENIEAGLRTDVDAANTKADNNATEIETLKGNLQEETSARQNDINSVNDSIDDLDGRVQQNTTDIAAEQGRAEAAESALSTRIDAITTGDDSLAAKIEALAGDVAQNAANIASNGQAINNEAARADAEEKRLAGLIANNGQAISNEAARADAEEKRLAGLIETNIQNIAGNAADIATNISNIGINTSAIQENANNITINANAIKAEAERAQNAEDGLNKAIAAEKARAEGIEAGLQSSIATEAANRAKALGELEEALTKAYEEADEVLREEINTKMAAADAMTFCGSTDGFSSHGDAAEYPLPDSGNKGGDTYIVTKAFNGYQVGDLLVADHDQSNEEILTSDEDRTNFWIWVKTGYSDFNDATLDVDITNNQIQLKSHLGENLGTVTLASQNANIAISTQAAVNGLDHTVNFNFVWDTF